MSTIEDTLRAIVHEEIAVLLERLAGFAPATAAKSIETLLSIADVVQLVGGATKPETVRGWCLSGKLLGRKAGRRWVVRREDLERFLTRSRGSLRSVPDQVDDLLRRARASGGR